jgi:hypothetical protein
MAFRNRVRLPIKLHKPQFVEESDKYRKANGVSVVLSVVIRKIYEGLTDSLPEKLHERLKIALRHDSVIIEGDKYAGAITQEGSYDIEWIDFLSKPIAQAKFKAEVTPFNASNSNCGTCEEYTQVVAEDDNLGTLNEDTDYNVGVIDNDSICCSPITQTIVSYNTAFVDAIVTNPDYRITLHIKANVPSANSVVLATYRIECQNGMYDEANLIANIVGTNPIPVCLAPTNPVLVSADSDTSATFSWTAPAPIPDCGYHWEVRNAFSVVLASGDSATTDATVTGLPSNENFLRFFVRSNCCSLDSNYAGPVIFSLPPPSDTESCGEYALYNSNLFFFRTVSYVDCNGDEQNIIITQNETFNICALQYSAGNPVQITPQNGDISVTYIGLC